MGQERIGLIQNAKVYQHQIDQTVVGKQGTEDNRVCHQRSRTGQKDHRPKKTLES